MGAKKFGMPLETTKIKFFWRDIPGFCRDIPAEPEKFERKKSLCSILVPYFLVWFAGATPDSCASSRKVACQEYARYEGEAAICQPQEADAVRVMIIDEDTLQPEI